MTDKTIKVRILPLHGIGGVGMAGDVVMMSEADAKMYVRDGFVEVVNETPPPAPPQMSTFGEGGYDDHKIMKPRGKRQK